MKSTVVGILAVGFLVAAAGAPAKANASEDCDPGYEVSGLLCYKPCKPGFKGVGPVCWQICSEGFKDDGLTCRRPGSIIGANTKDCPWYDKCGLTLKKGCSKCPQGYKNDGCTCRINPEIVGKKSYGRGVGIPLKKVSDAFKLAGEKIAEWGHKVYERLKEAAQKAKDWMVEQWNKVKDFFRNRYPTFPEPTVKLRFPLKDPKLYSKVSIWYADSLRGALGNSVFCRDFEGRWGIAFCYGDHKGTDYKLDGGFDTMDKGIALVVAAADGKVVFTKKDAYDRCKILDFANLHKHWTLGVVCDGKKREDHVDEFPANKVIIHHVPKQPDLVTSYAHFKKSSIVVNKDDIVSQGKELGLVGSSGRSSFPHLHFEVQRCAKWKNANRGYDDCGEWVPVDPYKGKYTQGYSYWCRQAGSAYDFPSTQCN